MKADQRLTPFVIERISYEIADASGHEVMFAGFRNSDGLVSSIEAAARGDEKSVPALAPYLEKGDVVIHNHPSGQLKPSQADLKVASYLGNQGIGFYIVDNSCTNIYVVSEPVAKKELEDLDVSNLEQVLLPGGALSRFIEGYETRDSQIGMLSAVANSFNQEKICVVEAGTGVGKSFAYLIPAIKWAENNAERVVVSTGTINLQQQLLEKDIPMAKKVLGSKIKAVLVKGRGNYLCHRRLKDALEEDSLFREEDDPLYAIQDWAQQTGDGSRSDLPFFPDASLWNKVNSEPDACMGLKCIYREKCFVLKARKEASGAHLLVTNHHLLFADLSMRLEGVGADQTAVLPPFHKIVFDEAHNIENSATSFFSKELNRFSLFKQLSRLHNSRRGKASGISLALQNWIGADENLLEIPGAARTVLAAMDHLEAKTQAVMNGDSTLTMNPGFREEIIVPLHDLQVQLTNLVDHLEKAIKELPEESEEDSNVFEAKAICRRLENMAGICQSFRDWEDEEGRVFWLEHKRTGRGESFVSFISTPLDIDTMMRDAVFEPYKTVICASATLSIKGNFGYWKSRVGLNVYDSSRIDSHIFPSPFPYKERVLLGVPAEAPDPSASDYTDFAAQFSRKVLELSEGSGLLLFTSYTMLKSVYDQIKPALESRGITVMKQGDDDRSRLLTRFRTDTASVLFATDSFWEGVDTPGDALKVVIITRLPFRVPTNPVVKARMEAIEKRGGKPFMELSLPEAVMRFKQGFGRLMRRHDDRGTVIILDPRVIRKTYGSLFLNSLPQTGRSIKPAEGLLQDLETFLYP